MEDGKYSIEAYMWHTKIAGWNSILGFHMKVPLMLNSEHMAPHPERMEHHVPYLPSFQIPNFFRFHAWDDTLA